MNLFACDLVQIQAAFSVTAAQPHNRRFPIPPIPLRRLAMSPPGSPPPGGFSLGLGCLMTMLAEDEANAAAHLIRGRRLDNGTARDRSRAMRLQKKSVVPRIPRPTLSFATGEIGGRGDRSQVSLPGFLPRKLRKPNLMRDRQGLRELSDERSERQHFLGGIAGAR